MPRDQLPATPPIAASETRADRRAHLHSTPYPIEVTIWAASVGVRNHGNGSWPKRQNGSTLGGFVDPCPSRQPPERAVTSNLGDTIPVTTGARTSTTATITSTYVTCSTVGRTAYVQDGRMLPSVGLTSMRPARQVFVSQPSLLIEPSGGFPRARDSLGTLRSEFENGRTKSPAVMFRLRSIEFQLSMGLVIGPYIRCLLVNAIKAVVPRVTRLSSNEP